MIIRFPNVNIRYLGTPATSLGDASGSIPVLVPCGTATLATVQAYPLTAAWGTAVLTVYRANDRDGPWEALSARITLGPGASMSAAIDCSAFAFLAVGISTAEGSASDEFVTIIISLRGAE